MTPDDLLKRLAFIAAPHERSAELRGDDAAMNAFLSDGKARFLPVWRQKHPFRIGDDGTATPLILDRVTTPADAVFLGVVSDTPWFGIALDDAVEQDLPAEFRTLTEMLPVLSADTAALMVHARARVIGRANHRFCGRCGAPTRAMDSGHSLTCTNPECAHRSFPRTDPAIITSIIHPDGEQILLGRQPSWPPGVYSTIAGFVEPGESLEAAVAREALEETGVHVSDVRYVASQPWPFPSSIMLGFTCRAITTAIHRYDGELEDCRWFTRAQVLAGGTRGDPGGDLKLSHPFSISRYLIDGWAHKPLLG